MFSRITRIIVFKAKFPFRISPRTEKKARAFSIVIFSKWEKILFSGLVIRNCWILIKLKLERTEISFLFFALKSKLSILYHFNLLSDQSWIIYSMNNRIILIGLSKCQCLGKSHNLIGSVKCFIKDFFVLFQSFLWAEMKYFLG